MKNFEILINERVIESINYILSSKIEDNKALLGQKLGVKPSKFSEILNKRMKAGMDVIQNLCIEYGISADWLITGNGMMLREEQISDESPPDQAEVIRMLKEKIHDQQEIITLLKEKIDVLQGGASESEADSTAAAG